MTEAVQPDGQTPVYNQDLKNPHLVETAVFFQPLQGGYLSQGMAAGTAAADFQNGLQAIRDAASKGNIPTIERTFRIQGVPVLLTDQSYLAVTIEPIFLTPNFEFQTNSTAIPNYFHIMHANWPKIASACIKSAQCTLSNFGISNVWPFYYNYINALSTTYSTLQNNKFTQFLTYMEYQSSSTGNFAYFGRDPEVRDFGRTKTVLANHLSPHSPHTLAFSLLSKKANQDGTTNFRAAWTPTNTLEIRIPLKEILPVFNVPVIPLLSTNAAQIELTITFYDPRYMFMIDHSLVPNTSYNLLLSTDAAVDNGLPAIKLADAASNNMPYIDFNAYTYLNLKVLTDPVNNPLARMYMEPFLDHRDLFRARYLDYYIFQQDVQISPGRSVVFNFKPSQLFYNMTHVALFFYDGGYLANAGADATQTLANNAQIIYSLQNARAQALKGHFVLSDHFEITDFQVGLGSSCTPLFSTPLASAQLEQMTIDHFQKYGKNNMVGSVLQSNMRMAQGDAFYVVDFTHAKGAGYFVDSDNMISITGKLNWLSQTPNLAGGYEAVSTEAAARTVSVIAVVFYTNNLEILLDQGGTVIVSQV